MMAFCLFKGVIEGKFDIFGQFAQINENFS